MNQNWRYIFPACEIQVEILPNTRRLNIIKIYLGLIATNSNTMSEQRSKTTRRKLCCEKLGTSHNKRARKLRRFVPIVFWRS